MSHRADRVWELFLPKEEETAPTQLHLFHVYGNSLKQMKQVNSSPQDDLFRAVETGHRKYERFYRRINRAVSLPLKQVKSAKTWQEKAMLAPSHVVSVHARPSDIQTVAHMGGIGPACRVFDVFAGKAISNILNTKEMRKWTN